MGSKDSLLRWVECSSLLKHLRLFIKKRRYRALSLHHISLASSAAVVLPWSLLLVIWLAQLRLKIVALARFIVSIGKLSSGSHNYYLNLGQEDYYLSGGEPPGTWFGAGAEALGLKGTVSKEVLSNLFRGYSPDGKEPWVRNAGTESRVAGFDSVASPPKTVSTVWSQSEYEIRKEFQHAQKEAVKKKNQYLEDVIAYCRKGKDGIEQIRAKLIMANFEHGVSRALDPQLHTHTLILNLGICEDGQVRALDGRLLYKHKMAAGAVYRAELARQLRQRLGVRIIPKKTWFEIAGVPQALCDHFSKRRKDIEAELGDAKLEIASAAAFAALTTRSPKSLVPPRSELFQTWQRTGREFGFDMSQVIPSKTQQLDEVSPAQVKALVKEAIERISRKRSCFNEAITLREALADSIKQDIDPESVHTEVRDQLHHWPEDSTWTDIIGRKQYTSLTGSKHQGKLKCYIDSLQRRSFLPDLSLLYVNRVIQTYRRTRSVLDSEIHYHQTQLRRAFNEKKTRRINRSVTARQALDILSRQDAGLVRRIVRNRGALQVVNSNGISNINTILRACNETWEKSKLEVWGFSLSRRAADNLERETAIRSRSFRAYELMRHPTLNYRVKYSVKQVIQEALFGYSYPLRPLKTKNKILVVNDAHQLDFEQMNELLSAVKQHGGRVVLIGSTDLRQERALAFDHVAHRARRNDRMKTRTDYFERTSQPTHSHSYEREQS